MDTIILKTRINDLLLLGINQLEVVSDGEELDEIDKLLDEFTIGSLIEVSLRQLDKPL